MYGPFPQYQTPQYGPRNARQHLMDEQTGGKDVDGPMSSTAGHDAWLRWAQAFSSKAKAKVATSRSFRYSICINTYHCLNMWNKTNQSFVGCLQLSGSGQLLYLQWCQKVRSKFLTFSQLGLASFGSREAQHSGRQSRRRIRRSENVGDGHRWP